MNGNRAAVGNALLWILIGEVISIFAFLPFAGWISIAFSLLGLYLATTANSGYRLAFYAQIFHLLIVIVVSVFGKMFFNTFLNMLSSILVTVVVYGVCTTTGQMLQGMSVNLASRASTIWKLYAVCMAIAVVCSLFMYIPILNILVGIVSIVTFLVSLIAAILYLVFLGQSSSALRSA